ncbi:divalent-cation tolerance protein CutA [Lignipirellula cremea]|uniref:Divalent-cation tolerance protein CutA n=1 Tax=Lignipirellula cremea TaxID=2528010 RepID=A0A518DMN5_9BACT|nr:divalent-cation tolerance protein CutA [Lignipirellula cremea]QDU93095.1 Divalent-cation tolerance protein CutA [Lignipirellula cremea]
MTSDLMQVTSTTDSRHDAEQIARLLVDRRLAACVQISGPITSIYRWQDRIETAEEWRLTIKTVATAWAGLEQAIRQAHPYDEPEILAAPITAASEGYQQWLREQVG